MMFALALIPIMIGAGVGLDFARAMLVRQQMSEALDAAALAVGSTSGLSQNDAQALAQKYFNANYTVDTTDYGTPTISIPASGYNSKGSVTITASDTMPTVLVKLIGVTSLPITTSSNVVWGQTKLWVALVLDNSGSMTQGDSSGSKMAALKSGANSLLDHPAECLHHGRRCEGLHRALRQQCQYRHGQCRRQLDRLDELGMSAPENQRRLRLQRSRATHRCHAGRSSAEYFRAGRQLPLQQQHRLFLRAHTGQ